MALNPDHYAIVIGIDGYVQLRPLTAAGKDATRFALWLTSEDGGGLPAKNIKSITSPPGSTNNPFEARPIQLQIDEALTRFGIESKGHIGKRLYFYFSGHGFGPNFMDVGMLMANASMTRLGNNIGLTPYRQFFREIEAFDEVVFILDCCRDPHGGIATAQPSFTLPKKGDGTKIQDVVILGAMYGEEAYQPFQPEFKDERRGLLTQAVLEGLTKPEAADGLGRFTSSSLSYYVTQRVPEMAKGANVDQTPNIDRTQLRHEIVFCTIPNSKLEWVRVQIVAPPGLNGNLLLLDSFGNELDRTPAATAVAPNGWMVSLLRNRWYEVKLSPPGLHTKPNIIELTELNGDPHVYKFKA